MPGVMARVVVIAPPWGRGRGWMRCRARGCRCPAVRTAGAAAAGCAAGTGWGGDERSRDGDGRGPRAEGADLDQRMVMDERIAAARALSHFNQRPAAQALVKVLQTEKDVALRDRVHESLQVATGKEFPPDPAAWDQYLRQASDKDFGEEKGSKIKLLSFFEWD